MNMRLNHTFALAGVMALGGLMIGGCSQHQGTASSDRPLYMEQSPASDDLAGGISTAMLRYDAGIGDTASGLGGGGNAR